MLSITPCQRLVSDRFPVASFVVHSPPDRLFEIACATDPALFRGEHRHRRTRDNFFTSRLGGLLRAPAGQATYLLPPEQLRRFAGARQVYYAMGSYGGLGGEDARFTEVFDDPTRQPSIQISPDFSGRSLDRTRLGRKAEPAPARYGSGKGGDLLWGGDLVAAAGASPARLGHGQTPAPPRGGPQSGRAEGSASGYDDGYSPELWTRPRAASSPAARGLGGAGLDEPEGFEDAPAIAAGRGAPLPGSAPAPIPLAPTAAAAPQAQRLGGARPGPRAARGGLLDEPRGFEDGVALARAQRAQPAPRANTGARLGGPAPAGAPRGAAAEPPGFEDGVALVRARAAGNSAGLRTAGRSPSARARPALGARAGARALADDAAPAGDTPAPASAAPAAPSGHDPDYDDDGDAVEPDLPADAAGTDTGLRAVAAAAPLTIPEKFRIIARVSRAQSGGPPGGYTAVAADVEHDDPSHPYFQRDHMGLCWGIVQVTQRSGALGRALSACQRRDPAQFAAVFGPHADELLSVTNAPTATQRLAPVGGSLLWQDEWVDRFRRAGAVPAFQAAQNEIAIEGYLDPNLTLARWLGFDTDRALAMLYDRCIDMGNGGGRAFVVDAVSPLHSQGQLAAALDALGFASLGAFQASVPGLIADGHWSPLTNAALVAALRALGASSPIAVPDREAMLDRLVQAAAGRRFEARLADLRHSGDLRDSTWRLVV